MTAEVHVPTIMIVDDTPANLKLLHGILAEQGFRVAAFPRGALALEAARKSPPDLILLDINMPEMNGFQVCEQLKADDALKEIPILFISARNESMDKVKGFALGAVDYVPKPFQIEEVIARVNAHMRIHLLQLELEKHNLHLDRLVKEKVREISDSQMATIIALARLAESRDDDTGKHIERTQTYCRILAHQLRRDAVYTDVIDDIFIDNIYRAAPLHDIGKVGIPDAILLKPGKLTADEFDTMKGHSLIGYNTLMVAHENYPKNAFIKTGIDIARSHHEKWDGSGYPDGLVGADIPLPARIMAVADVYDALRTKRVYKPEFSHDKAAAIILDGEGQHFDPAIVAAFRSVEDEFGSTREKLDDSNL